MDKYMSIIMNFGCHYKCPYYIVKMNNLHIPITTLSGLDMLSKKMITTSTMQRIKCLLGIEIFRMEDNA